MAYIKQNWQDRPSTATPITATRLEHIEQGIADVDITTPDSPAQVAMLDAIANAEPAFSFLVLEAEDPMPAPEDIPAGTLVLRKAATPA